MSVTKILLASSSVLLLAACAGLPSGGGQATAGTSEVYRSDSVSLYQAAGFDAARYRGLKPGRVEVAVPPDADADARRPYEDIRKALAAALPSASPDADAVTMDVSIDDVRLVHPVLNLVSVAAVFLPLDDGAMTVTARYRDASGALLAVRTERVTGSPFDVWHAFSSAGRLKEAAGDWAKTCGAWPACAVSPEKKPEKKVAKR